MTDYVDQHELEARERRELAAKIIRTVRELEKCQLREREIEKAILDLLAEWVRTS